MLRIWSEKLTRRCTGCNQESCWGELAHPCWFQNSAGRLTVHKTKVQQGIRDGQPLRRSHGGEGRVAVKRRFAKSSLEEWAMDGLNLTLCPFLAFASTRTDSLSF